MIFTCNAVMEAATESELSGYPILIPRAYAREESNDTVRKFDNVSKIDHYELYISRQIGTVKSRRNTYVYIKLPKSGTYIPVVLYTDGGVGFDPMHRKYALREFDELDRRIILGYCRKYQATLTYACHRDGEQDRRWLQDEAIHYRASSQPKRFKQGSEGKDFTTYYKLEPYDESNKFKNIVLV